MNILKKLILFSFVMSLLGCETLQKKKSQHELMNDMNKKNDQCIANAEKKHIDAFEYVSNNIRIRGNNTKNKYDLLTSTRLYNQSDELPLSIYLASTGACYDSYVNDMMKINQSWGMLTRNQLNRFDYIYGEFMMKKLTVSEFNKKYDEAISEFMAEWNRIMRK